MRMNPNPGKLLRLPALVDRRGPTLVVAPLDGSVAPPERPVVVSCGSGVTACHTAFAFRLAGLPDPILYPGSYSDWSRTDLPVATGAEPGEPIEPTAEG